jgi:hypothetical protein
MPSSTLDWSALTSQNEKIVDDQAVTGPGEPTPAAERPARQGGRHRAAGRADAGPRWRIRGSHAAAGIFQFGD